MEQVSQKYEQRAWKVEILCPFNKCMALKFVAVSEIASIKLTLLLLFSGWQVFSIRVWDMVLMKLPKSIVIL